MSISVLHFITELSTGGAQMALLKLLRNIDRERFSPRVVCLFNGDRTVGRSIEMLGIPVTDLGMANKARIDAFARLYRLIRQEQPTILHTWMFHANVPGRVIGRMCGVPIIISSERLGKAARMRRLLDRLTSPMADRFTAVSNHSARFLIDEVGIAASKAIVIPNGIDLTDFDGFPGRDEARAALGLQHGDAVVVSICRLDNRQKGLNFLVDAWTEVAAINTSARLLIAGAGPDRDALEQQVARLRLQSSIIFLGERVPRDLLPAADVFVLPSLFEGMPNVVLEAMAASVPVVATAVGGTPEVVVDGETGFLVPPGDSTAISNGLLRLLDDPETAKRFGRASRLRIERHFPLSETVRSTEALYTSLLQQKHILHPQHT